MSENQDKAQNPAAAGTREGVSRRKFLAGAGAGLVVGAVAGAAIGSLGFPETVTKTLTQTQTVSSTITSTQTVPGLPSTWDVQTDVVVIGSGGAGLNAAIGALEAGAKVIVLEKAPAMGGTTLLAAAALWIPNSSLAAATGSQYTTPNSDVIEYINAIGEGEQDPDLINTYLQQAPAWLDHMMSTYKLAVTLSKTYSDYCDKPGLLVFGNSLSAGGGAAYIKALSGAVSSLGGTTMVNTPATALYQDLNKRIVGVQATPIVAASTSSTSTTSSTTSTAVAGKPINIGVNKGVILAAGGFDWNAEMMAHYMRGPIDSSGAPSTNTGDGVMMAMKAGAWMRNMNNAWYQPAYIVPNGSGGFNNVIVGHPPDNTGLPGAIVVNRFGKRFVDESTAYPMFVRPFHQWSTVTEDYINYPAYTIIDSVARSKYSLAGVPKGPNTPSWITQADTLQDLATALGIDPAGLQATVATFNTYAASGIDPDFKRGQGVYDMNNNGDWSRTTGPNADLKNGCLGPISTPPFYGVEIHPAIIGTCGGPRINSNGQVLDQLGNPIPGLYGAGNNVAAMTGAGYTGGGGTIGPASVFGYLAGKSAGSA